MLSDANNPESRRVREKLTISLTFVVCISLLACDTGGQALPQQQSRAYSKNTSDAPASLPHDFHRGVNHAHIHRRGHGYGSPVSASELDSLRTLGVTWIALTPFGYQRGTTGDEIVGFPGNEGPSEFFSRTDPTLTDDDLLKEISNAHSRDMRVTLKPHIWSHDFWDGNEWHGSIRQTSREAHLRWWKSYRAFALHYARVATETGADMYCLGTELVELSTRYPEEWRELIRDVRKVYTGLLTYAAHWEREFDHISFWDSLDYIGINAYFPLDTAGDEEGVEHIAAAWKLHRQRIAKIAERFQRPVLFLEAGYRPIKGAHKRPWLYKGRSFDADAQARAYEALFQAFKNASWWKGIYIWKTFTDPQLKYERKGGFSFRGYPAENVLRKWYGAGHEFGNDSSASQRR